MAGGRPTLYKPEYCDLVIEMGKKGKYVVQMANEIGVSEDSLHEWAKVHEEFCGAFTLARQHSKAFWCEKGHELLHVEKGSSVAQNIFVTLMRNMHAFDRSQARRYNGISKLESEAAQAAHVMKMMDEGDITDDECTKLLAIIAKKSEIRKNTEIADRVTNIESMLEEMKNGS